MEGNVKISTKNTVIGRTVMLARIYSDWLVRLVFLAIWLGGLFSIIIIGSHYAGLAEGARAYLGPAFILAGVFLFYLSQRAFFQNKLRNPRLKSPKDIRVELSANKEVNLFAAFSLGLATATNQLFQKDWTKLTTKDLLESLFKANDLNFILLRLGLTEKSLEEALAQYKGTPEIGETILRAVELADQAGRPEVTSGDVLAALCETDDFVEKLANHLKIDASDISELVGWQCKLQSDLAKSKDFFNPEHFRLTGGFGMDWAFGYTLFLRRFSIDITQSIRESGLNLEIIGRDEEIRQIEEALLHQANGNVIVVGDAGSGKRTTILGFAKRVLEGTVPGNLSHKHIFQVDTDALLAGTSDPGQLVASLRQLLSEAASAGNVIIFIENINNLLSDGSVGRANAAEVLIPWLDRGGVHIIGTCDIESYNKVILDNSALTQRFTRVTIEEPKKQDMIRILLDTLPEIEYRTGALISYEAVKETLKAADKYILNLPNPEKSIALLDGAATKAVSNRGKTIVLPKDVGDYVSEKYAVPSVELGDNEKSALLNLEEEIHKTVIGQNEPVKALANAMRRSRAQVSESSKPIGSFLFLGPTGVGKTALAKALARSYFGSEVQMIRFDMSEYQNKEDIYRLIGGNGEAGQLATKIREKPFSLLLFDEIEKAHPDILNLFLQVLDEGFMTDAGGKKVAFRNAIIIATSNAGANVIREAIQRNIPYDTVKEKLVDYLVKNNLFRPEFLNRFTGVIAFTPLTLPEISEIAKLMIARLQKETYTNQGIKLEIDDEAIAILAKQGFDPEMGARPMERVIQEKIENLLAEKILKNELGKGDSFAVTKEMIG